MEIIQGEAEVKKSQIAPWYAGKSILITGATGFMGKVLVEKLLRSCSGLKMIYLLIRSKKGVDAIARKEQFFKCVIFNKLLENNPDIINKIQVVKGDVMECDLGLSSDDTNELASKVEVIFHVAANVRFDQPLRPLIEMNVAGTLKVLKLAEKMSNLRVFVHVSTTYNQCNEHVLEERAYTAPHDPFEIMKMVDTMDDKTLAQITPQLLNGLPNTYSFSKALSEDLINRYEHKLPIVITRPSIVTAAVSEPLPGWVEGLNGPNGYLIGAARGVIRTVHCNPEYKTTIIPVDKAINGMIIAGYERAQSKKNETQFYNLTISNKLLTSWGECIDTGRRLFRETPLSFSLWYPDGSLKSNYYHHLICVILFHYLPAYCIDFLLLICRKKPFLVRIQNRITNGSKLLEYYGTHEWDFKTERFQQLSAKLNEFDQDEFDTSVSYFNWEQYISIYIHGLRKYLIGENEDTIPHAKRVLRRLYILDRVTTYCFYALIFWFLWTHLDSVVERSDALIRSSLQMLYGNCNKTVPT